MQEIKRFLDSATDGVIYFSLGSNVKGMFLSNNCRKIFIKVFSSLKQKIIWKFEEKIEMPKNLLIGSWLPQSDILSHPNVKLFITHGGLLSTTESVYHGVPVIGIPFFGDQSRNLRGASKSGWGLHLDYSNITETSLRWAINEVLYNGKYVIWFIVYSLFHCVYFICRYSEAIKVVSQRYRDQPLSPIETAVYWCEYVIRNKGASHLRSGSMDLSFFQYHNIDVFMLLFVSSLMCFFTIFMVCKKCCGKICLKGNIKEKKLKKNQ